MAMHKREFDINTTTIQVTKTSKRRLESLRYLREKNGFEPMYSVIERLLVNKADLLEDNSTLQATIDFLKRQNEELELRLKNQQLTFLPVQEISN